ncbi:MAG: hypothetical protein F6K10_38255 [Moorea sp. SIO2B7]|nr:hypothetical protein [Moorena sp. SIO2B7]
MMNRYFFRRNKALGILTLGLSLILFDSTVSAATLIFKLKYLTINNWKIVQKYYDLDFFYLEKTYITSKSKNKIIRKYQINNSPEKFPKDNQNDVEKQKIALENAVPSLPQVKEYSKVDEGVYYFEADLSFPNLEADNLNNKAKSSSNQTIEVEDIIYGQNYSLNSQYKKVNFFQRVSDYSGVPGIAYKNLGSSLKPSLSDATNQIRNFSFNLGFMNLLKKATGVNQNKNTPSLGKTSYLNILKYPQSYTDYTYNIPYSKLKQQLWKQLQQLQKKEKKSTTKASKAYPTTNPKTAKATAEASKTASNKADKTTAAVT